MAKKQTLLAAQLYTLRDFLKTPADMKTTFKKLNKIGYTAGQISGVGPIEPKDLRKLMLDCGIEPMGAHVGMDEFKNDIKGVIKKCQDWGIGYVAIPWMAPDAVKTAAGWKQMGKLFEGYGKVLAKEGIVLQYHNHAFEFEKFGIKGGKGGQIGLDILFASANAKYLQAELDLGWVARGGHNPVNWVNKMKGRLDQVHFKDWGIRNNEPVWRAVGEGGIDWPAVIKACKAAGTIHFIVEQDNCPITNDPFVSLKVSFGNLKKMGL